MANWSHKEIEGRRVRLIRLSDVRFAYGWLNRLRGQRMEISCTTEFDPREGDRFRVECQGPGFTAITQAPLLRVLPQEDPAFPHVLEFQYAQKLQIIENTEDPRRLADGETVHVNLLDRALQGRLLDISTRGLGIALREGVPKGSWAEIEVRSGLGLVEGKAVVRYCKVIDESEPKLYRAGFELIALNRMDALRWGRLIRAA